MHGGREREREREDGRWPDSDLPRRNGVVPYRVCMCMDGATWERSSVMIERRTCVAGDAQPFRSVDARQLTTSPTRHIRHRERGRGKPMLPLGNSTELSVHGSLTHKRSVPRTTLTPPAQPRVLIHGRTRMHTHTQHTYIYMYVSPKGLPSILCRVGGDHPRGEGRRKGVGLRSFQSSKGHLFSSFFLFPRPSANAKIQKLPAPPSSPFFSTLSWNLHLPRYVCVQIAEGRERAHAA
jgi:hypothetical protein